jgi:hypothetical protein
MSTAEEVVILEEENSDVMRRVDWEDGNPAEDEQARVSRLGRRYG